MTSVDPHTSELSREWERITGLVQRLVICAPLHVPPILDALRMILEREIKLHEPHDRVS